MTPNTTTPMSPAEFHKLIEKMDLSVYAAAKVLGVSISTAQRYANGNSKVPEPVARLLRLLINTKRGNHADI